MAIEIAGYGLNEELPLIGVSIWDMLVAVIVLIVGVIVVSLVTSMLQKWMIRAKLAELLTEFTTRILRIIMYIFVVGIALTFMGLGMDAALVSISVVLGFALGGTLSNIAAGFMIAVTRPFKTGDYVTMNWESGSVQSVGISVTELDTPDNKRVIIPNKSVWGGSIVNFTRHGARRVDMEVGVSYDDDLDHVIQTTMELLADDERVLPDPAPQVAVTSLGDNAVVLVVRPWVKTGDYWSFYIYQNTPQLAVGMICKSPANQ